MAPPSGNDLDVQFDTLEITEDSMDNESEIEDDMDCDDEIVQERLSIYESMFLETLAARKARDVYIEADIRVVYFGNYAFNNGVYTLNYGNIDQVSFFFL